MEFSQVIKSRKSIRGFKLDEVSQEVLSTVLEMARLSPSGINHQPWEFVILTGESLQKAKALNEEKAKSGAEATPDLPGYQLTGVYRDRQVALGKQMFEVMNISRDDAEKRMDWALKGMRFYDAPAAILLMIDDAILNERSPMALLDMGIVTQSIALAAVDCGLGTCIQGATVFYAASLKKLLGIPESKKLAVGIAIGYPDPDFPGNRIQTERESLANIAIWKD